jgi:hypothetical protein
VISSSRAALAVSVVAYLAFLERAFLDWRFVYDEVMSDTDVGTAIAALTFYVALAGIWLWALMAAGRGSRAALVTLLGLALVLLVGLGAATFVSFCPSPCQTAWPLMEVSNWIGLVVGLVASGVLIVQLRGTPRMS